MNDCNRKHRKKSRSVEDGYRKKVQSYLFCYELLGFQRSELRGLINCDLCLR